MPNQVLLIFFFSSQILHQIFVNPVLIPIESFNKSFLFHFALFVYTLGLLCALVAKLDLGKSWGMPMFHFRKQAELKTTGIYKFSRNPIYLGEMLMLLGFELALPSYFILLIFPSIVLNYRKAKARKATRNSFLLKVS